MRYFSLAFLSLFIILSVIFAYQNDTPVAITFSLDWLYISFNFAKRPVYIPIFVAFAAGMVFATFFLFVTHSYLRLQLKSKKNEIFRLKKLILLEREKHEKLIGGDIKTENQNTQGTGKLVKETLPSEMSDSPPQPN